MVVVYTITISIYLPHTSDGGHSPVEGNYVLLKVGCKIPNYICTEEGCVPHQTHSIHTYTSEDIATYR